MVFMNKNKESCIEDCNQDCFCIQGIEDASMIDFNLYVKNKDLNDKSSVYDTNGKNDDNSTDLNDFDDDDIDYDMLDELDDIEYDDFELNNTDNDEVEIVELEDENGDIEEFIIFEEFSFDDKRFAIVAPLAEVQAKRNSNQEISASDFDGLNIGVLEVCGNYFAIIEDELYVKNLLLFLDEMSINAEDE